jgi:hypothetical protein
VRSAGGHDQPVVAHLGAILQANGTLRCVYGRCFAEQYGRVCLVRQDMPDGRRDCGRRKTRRCNLVEQRAEKMVIGAVEDRQVDGGVAQPLRRPQAAKAATEDYNARSADVGPWARAAMRSREPERWCP